ncbi:MAG: amino acid permease [Gemmatimonadaceae bacterium]
MTQDTNDTLVRAIGLRALAANTVNNIIGSGIFVLPAVVAATLGASAMIAYLICAVAVALVALCFAESGSRVSASGGTYAYVETAFGPYVGFLEGVLLFGSQITASAAIATVLAGSLAVLVPSLGGTLPRAAVLVVLYATLAVTNIRGLRSGVRLVEVVTAAKLAPLVALVIAGAFFIHRANFVWTRTPTFAEIGTASLGLVFAFTGMEGAMTSSGEVKNPSRTVPRALFLGLGMVTALYVSVQLVAQGVLGADLSTDQTAPLAAVAGRIFGRSGSVLIAVAAAVSAFGYLSGDMLATPRVLFAFARDGFLPRWLGAVHPGARTPAAAIAVHAAVCCGLALSGTFVSLVVLSTVSTLFIYFTCCLATIELRRRDVRTDGEPFRIPGGPLVPVLACGVVLWMLSSATRKEFTSVGLVLALASLLYAVRRIRTRTGAAPATIVASET